MVATLNSVLILFSALSFLGYGAACFLSSYMKRELERYRLASQCTLVGGLQLCAAVGLLAGLNQPWMGRAAAGGLALMMLVAVGVRIKIKDTLPQMIPALFYLALNAYLSRNYSKPHEFLGADFWFWVKNGVLDSGRLSVQARRLEQWRFAGGGSPMAPRRRAVRGELVGLSPAKTGTTALTKVHAQLLPLQCVKIHMGGFTQVVGERSDFSALNFAELGLHQRKKCGVFECFSMPTEDTEVLHCNWGRG